MQDIDDRLTDVTLDLFKSMMGLEAREGQVGDLPLEPGKMDIVAFIGLSSGQTSGMVGVYSSSRFARRMVGAMVGVEPADVDDEVRDGFGEVANIIAGNLASALSDMGETVQLSLPSVIVGKCLVTSILHSVPPRRARRFSVDNDELYVELALRRGEN